MIDSSAVFAVLLREPESAGFLQCCANAPTIAISAANWVEVTVVNLRRRLLPSPTIESFRTSFRVAVLPVTAEQAELACAAYTRFGQASGHRARLNFGDCFAYALAKATGEPLLFKGDDFSRTDVASAL